MTFYGIFYSYHERVSLIISRDRHIIIDMDDLRKKILGEPLVSRVFEAGVEAYLVGGYLRDILRGMMSKDIDFVIKDDPRNLVTRIFPDLKKSIIEFKKVLMVRVVTGSKTIDFSELKEGIEDDLKRRDFTMNAIAWSPEKGVVDPLEGTVDIKNCMIKSISEKNFMNDPLRLLRTYRFSAELGWVIDGGTRKIIRKLKNSIKQSATERITLEIFKLLNSDGHLNALNTAVTDGLLQEILAIKNNQLKNNIKALSRFKSFLKKVPEEYEGAFNETFSQELTYIGLLRAEQLLYGSSLKRNNLRLSGAIQKRIMLTTKLLREYEKNRTMNASWIFDIFTEAGDAVMDFALLARREKLLKKAERFMNIQPALPTEKVMEITALVGGPGLGALLKEMRRLQFIGKIRNEKDARAWLSKRSSSSS